MCKADIFSVVVTFLLLAAHARVSGDVVVRERGKGGASTSGSIDFEKTILPILDAKCMKCHTNEHVDSDGKLKKPKGRLIMNTAEGLKKGGAEYGSQNIVAGRAAESRFYIVTTLTVTDEYFMPPEGKADPLTDDEKALLKKWIDEGANFGSWAGKPK